MKYTLNFSIQNSPTFSRRLSPLNNFLWKKLENLLLRSKTSGFFIAQLKLKTEFYEFSEAETSIANLRAIYRTCFFYARYSVNILCVLVFDIAYIVSCIRFTQKIKKGPVDFRLKKYLFKGFQDTSNHIMFSLKSSSLHLMRKTQEILLMRTKRGITLWLLTFVYLTLKWGVTSNLTKVQVFQHSLLAPI